MSENTKEKPKETKEKQEIPLNEEIKTITIQAFDDDDFISDDIIKPED